MSGFTIMGKIKAFLLKNTTLGQTIAKNTIWLFSGQLLSRLFRATIVVYAARVLGVSSWGAFSYALGIVTFLTIFSDIGINALLTKEASRSPEIKNQYLATAFFIKLGLLIILFLGTTGLFPYLSRIEEASAIMPILLFVFAFDTLRDLGSALSRAMEKMEIEASVQIATNFAIAALGFLFLYLHRTGESLAYAYALGSGIGLIIIIYAMRPYFKNIAGNFNAKLIKPILTTAWPFGLLGLMGVVMLNTDIIMLGWLRTPSEVGYYSAAQKLIQLLYVFPTLIAVSIFPALSRLTMTDAVSAKKTLERGVALAILAAIPIAALGILGAAPIIKILFGAAYLPSIATFKILMATVLMVYPASILGHAIFAYDQQKNFIAFVAVATVGNVVFNFLLIPRWGIEGAALATVITQFITNILIWKKIKDINKIRVFPEIKNYLAFAAGLIRKPH